MMLRRGLFCERYSSRDMNWKSIEFKHFDSPKQIPEILTPGWFYSKSLGCWKYLYFPFRLLQVEQYQSFFMVFLWHVFSPSSCSPLSMFELSIAFKKHILQRVTSLNYTSLDQHWCATFRDRMLVSSYLMTSS